MKQYVNFNYAEKVNKRSQGENETEFLQSHSRFKTDKKTKGENYLFLMKPAFFPGAPIDAFI